MRLSQGGTPIASQSGPAEAEAGAASSTAAASNEDEHIPVATIRCRMFIEVQTSQELITAWQGRRFCYLLKHRLD